MERLRRVGVDASAVSREHVLGEHATERRGRAQPQQRMDAERFARRAEVPHRPERIRHHEHAQARPPERGLAPEAAAGDGQELERGALDPLGRDDVKRDAESLSGPGAVALVAIEQLDDAARLAETARPRLGLGPGDRVDQPDAAVGRERVRRAPERVGVVEPAEAEILLVAEAH
jgi:hypothetical protein